MCKMMKAWIQRGGGGKRQIIELIKNIDLALKAPLNTAQEGKVKNNNIKRKTLISIKEKIIE